MKKRKSYNRNRSNSYHDDDMEAMRGKGTRKEKRRSRRSHERQGLRDMANGNLDPDEYMDHMDENDSKYSY